MQINEDSDMEKPIEKVAKVPHPLESQDNLLGFKELTQQEEYVGAVNKLLRLMAHKILFMEKSHNRNNRDLSEDISNNEDLSAHKPAKGMHRAKMKS